MYDWTKDRYKCIQYLIENSDYHWSTLNTMTDALLIDLVRYDLELDEPKIHHKWNS